jgi:hypothetical protein
MRTSLFLCIAAALSTGCASRPPTQVATATATTPAPFVEGIPIAEAVKNNQPVALDIITTRPEGPPSANDADELSANDADEPSANDADNPSANHADKVVCKQIATIGTRLTRRVCKTQQQIAYEREQAQKVTEGHQRPAPLQDSTGQARGLAIH